MVSNQTTRALMALALFALPGPPTGALAGPPAGEGWTVLFDGKGLDAWRGFRMKGLPPNWSIDDGTLKTEGRGAGLVTREEFSDFDLRFEWRVTPNGNSGVLYWVSEAEPYPADTGPEFQVIDNGYFKSPSPLQSAGALYALYPAKKEAPPKRVGEWNTGRVHAEKGRVRHWLNGKLVVDARYASEDWRARVARSKFAKSKVFAKSARGHISLQEHGTPVWFRNIRVRRLPGATPAQAGQRAGGAPANGGSTRRPSSSR